MFVGILCAGSQKRRNKDNLFPQFPYKQLIEVDKQPLLSKTINQLKERGYDPVIITKNEELKIDKSFEPEDNRYTVSSLLSTRPLREGRNVILLGDVNYSEQALDKIFDFKEDIKVFGSKGEIFAINFADLQRMERNLRKAIKRGDKNPDNKMVGKLWTFYRILEDFDVLEHKFGKYYNNIKDKETRDFDSQIEYKEWLEENAKKTYTVNIMTHSSRKEHADKLKSQINKAYVSTCDDGIQKARGQARTIKRKDTDYHIVLQDDSILCDGFLEKMEKVLKLGHPVINFHTRDRKQLRKYKGKGNFFDDLYGGVAVCIKSELIDEMVKWCMDEHIKTNNTISDDKMMRIYFKKKGIKCYYTNPCYVDHNDLPCTHSLFSEKTLKQRRGSLEFLGTINSNFEQNSI